MNESKLMQMRAGIITESEYQESMEEIGNTNMVPFGSPHGKSSSTFDAQKEPKMFTSQGEVGVEQDKNIDAILQILKSRTPNLKPIDTSKEIELLMKSLITTIQSLNKDALTNQEVILAINTIKTKLQQPK